MDCRFCLVALSVACATTSVVAQDMDPLSVGSYRIEGACSRSFYLGAASPECDRYLGIAVENPSKPMIIFPLRNGGQGWFFVTSGQVSANSDRTIYQVEKLYDQALNAEFSYPAGECEITSGPTVRCALWKDAERTVLARELVFSGSGKWMHTK